MNVVAPRDGAGFGHAAQLARGVRPADAAELAGSVAPDFRSGQRAVSELRRGTPVLLRTGDTTLLALAAETMGGAGLAEFLRAAGGPALLLLDAGRAAHWSVGHAPAEAVVAFRIPEAMLQPELLLGMADPTARQMLTDAPAAEPPPAGAAAALLLAKLARLLPAVLVAPLGVAVADTDLLAVAAGDVLRQRAALEAGLVQASQARVPLQDAADCRVVAFRSADAGPEHLAVLVGAPEAVAAGAPAPLARIHSECFTGDLLGSLRCDCGPQLRGAIRRMAAEGAGVLLYLAQEGRGIGLANKLRAYALQDTGLDTLDANRALGWGADERSFAAAAAMLRSLGIGRVRLLTNNPKKLAALADGGIAVERVSHLVAANGVNDAYLATKADRFGHLGD